MEREANELLAKGDQEAAAAKFSEADRIAQRRVTRRRQGGRVKSRDGPGSSSDRGHGCRARA